jgi:hypothetical protein
MVAGTQNVRELRQWLCWRSEERNGKLTTLLQQELWWWLARLSGAR